jgi:hypothetical protein
MFKKAFCDPEIFTAFVRDVAGVQLEIDHVETEKAFTLPIGYVAPRFDLFAEDKKNRIIVDIQHVRHPDHYDRFLHYHSVALIEQVKSFYDYAPGLQVFTIVVRTSGDKHKTDISIVDFRPRTLDGRYLPALRHKIVFLCPKYANEQTPEPYREWLRAINDSLDGEVEESGYLQPLIRKIFDYIEKDLVSPEERARVIEENQQQAQFNEGIAEGLEQGVAQGLAQGLEQGRAQGLEQGAAQALATTAKGMLAKGLAPDLVAEITGLSETQIRALTEE